MMLLLRKQLVGYIKIKNDYLWCYLANFDYFYRVLNLCMS